ncbi:hypothetical protein OG982_06175 [Streptomyces sp. NBC_01551]|uniref:hypothetical protein n=1 Tax=Streptomyces sp. NBC_01551 TaxID=2975876 RepID=UPI0022551F9F|nr:hypothetical protein [Streptomyces sp. NBC_01551]MCX4525280.1 hypothetical protein [Streptomyces sp. NBC_01551]
MTATPHPASTAPAHANPVFRAVTRRDGRLCRAAPECWELATVLTPADPAVRLVDAVHLPTDALTAVCAPHAADADRAGRRIREEAAAAALTSDQLALFTT